MSLIKLKISFCYFQKKLNLILDVAHAVSVCVYSILKEKFVSFTIFFSELQHYNIPTQESCIHFVYKNCTRCIQLIYKKCIQNIYKMYLKFRQTFVYILYAKLKEL